jgi:N-acetylneuraminic acid mutarotase
MSSVEHKPRVWAILAAALLVPALGCNEDIQQPSAPVAAAPELSTGTAAVAAANTWLVRADLPSTERFGPAVATVKNAAGQSVVYVIGGRTSGGLSKVQAYNTATNTWTYRASLPVPIAGSNGAGVIGGKIYISGGYADAHSVYPSLYVYDPAANKWSQKADMPSSGADGVTGVINSKLYVLTDCEDPERCVGGTTRFTLYRYDPLTDRWTTLRATRADGSLVYHPLGMGGGIGGKFYVVGRQAGEPGQPTNLDVYDPATDQWTSRAPLPRSRWGGAGVALGGKLYVIGGTTSGDDGTWRAVRTTSVYDPATNTWTNKTPMPNARSGIGGSPVTVNGQGRIEVVGGRRPGNNLQYVP